jgi:hypothetical protein
MYWLLIYFLFWSFNYGQYDGLDQCTDAGTKATKQSWVLNFACVPMPVRNHGHDHK